MNPSKKKILFADDSPSMRLFSSLCLGDDFEIDTASDGEEALKLIREKSYDLFLLDVYMPEIDGITLLKIIRENPDTKFRPVLIISTEADKNLLEQAKKAGATGWIVKPFEKNYFLKTVKHILLAKE